MGAEPQSVAEPIRAEALALGGRVTALRALSGMSLRGLALAAGVSPSFISQLEAGRTNATVASIRKVAAALGVTPAHLIDGGPVHTRGVLHAWDRPHLPLEGADKYLLTPGSMRNLEVWAGIIEPGGTTGAAYTHGNSQELFVVTAGQVIFELGGEEHILVADDSIEYLSSTPHRAANESPEEARVLWVTSPPTVDSSESAAAHDEEANQK